MNDLKKVLPVGVVALVVVIGLAAFLSHARQNVVPPAPTQNQQTSSTQVVPPAPADQVTSTTPVVTPSKTSSTSSTTATSSSSSALNKKTWYWVSTVFSGGTRVTPKKSGAFSITFDPHKKTISIKTDCNGAGADYVLNGNKLTFIGLRSTQMYCEQSQELAFTSVITETAGYHFLSTGGLALDLKNGSGTMFFR